MKHRTHKDFPSYRFYSDGRGQSKPTYVPIKRRKCIRYSPEFIKAIQKEANKKTYDELIREYNIPMGSIGYILKKGKSLGNGSIVINIDRVIIKG